MNVKAVLSGWGRALGLMQVSGEARERSVWRMTVCGSCEHARESRVLEFISEHACEIDTLRCTVCGCPCHQKSLTDDVCPLGKWDIREGGGLQ